MWTLHTWNKIYSCFQTGYSKKWKARNVNQYVMEYKSVSGFFDIFIGCWENPFWTWRVEYFPTFLALGSVKEVVLRISKESHTDWRIGKRGTLELSFSKIHQIFIRNQYAWSKGIKIKIELKFSARNGLALGSYIKAVSFDSLNFRSTSHWGFTPLKTLSTSKNTNFASFFAKLFFSTTFVSIFRKQ